MEDESSASQWSRTFYQNMVDAIEQSKKRQWSITNYVLLLYAAIVGYCQSLEKCLVSIDLVERNIFQIMAVTISFLGIWNIIDTHGTQYTYRNHIKYMRLYNYELHKLLHVNENEYFHFTYYLWPITCGQIIIVIIATALFFRYTLIDHDIYLMISVVALVTLLLSFISYLFYIGIKKKREAEIKNLFDRKY